MKNKIIKIFSILLAYIDLFSDICPYLHYKEFMNEILTSVDVRVMGTRFAQIRKKIGLSQLEVAHQLGTAQIKVSQIERGNNVLSPLFLAMLLFYTQHVSSEVLLSKNFDIEDENLFNKNYAMVSVAKAKIQILRDEFEKQLKEQTEDMVRRLNETADLL